jgi:hypothetical protein
MALILTGSSGSTTLDSSAGLTFSDSSNQQYAAGPYVLKNKLINGAMVIDQRNSGASGTASGFMVDRWQVGLSQASKLTWQQNAGSVTPPVGYTNYLGFTSSSAYTVLTGDYFYFAQKIEGLNVSDLAWGTVNAKTITLSFQVYSSLTGTFGGALTNSATNRSYAFSYTISSANTWTTISVTIAGDTTGTWLTTNGIGIEVRFGLGAGSTYSGTAGTWAASNLVSSTGATSVVGTNGATFYITGVQLEVGSTATPFERRLYNQELANCQRYFEISQVQGTAITNNQETNNRITFSWYSTNNACSQEIPFAVVKRAAATLTYYSPNFAASSPNQAQYYTGSAWVNATGTTTYVSSTQSFSATFAGTGTAGTSNICGFGWTASAEL